MRIKKIHYLSGLIIAIFVGLHLFNHTCSLLGPERHIEVMRIFRLFYRNSIAETVLLIAVLVQIVSGLKLFNNNRRLVVSDFEKLHIWSGLYLAIFLVLHVGAVLAGRFYLHLDTNFYFGVAGLNNFPTALFFIPYYALAVISFFGHIAAIHHKKMKKNIWGFTPYGQSKTIVIFGIFVTLLIFYGLTGHFNGVKIPAVYNVLIGK